MDFKEARKFVRSLKLNSTAEWQQYTRGKLVGKPKMPDDIPISPQGVYQDKGWQGMGDWLGNS